MFYSLPFTLYSFHVVTLRSKILLKICALLGCFALLGACAVWGFASLHTSNRVLQTEFEELRQIRRIGVHLAADKALIPELSTHGPQFTSDLRIAIAELHKFISDQEA